ncbi:MAG: serine/threonine protein kinase [Gemmatimonadaceae bacterium]
MSGQGVKSTVDLIEQASTTPLSPRVHRVASGLPERYKIQREISEGGAAHIFLAEDVERNQLVAIKVLRTEVATQAGERRFHREIEIIRGLQHPNIVPLLEYGTIAGRMYFTTPYIHGDTLRARIKRESELPLGDALSIASDVAAALDYAHARGIIHRDIKPGNILLASAGAIVADFGIARAISVHTGESITVSGVSLGTPEYMSPEQCGAMRELDARCDVYALGCVVYEMLTGEPPFTGASEQAVIARHFSEPPHSIRVVRPSIPRGVDHAISKALSKTRAHRYYSAGEFFDALDAGVRAADRG